MTHSILLVGSGNIGRRHLQALLAADRHTPVAIDIVEPAAEARSATAKMVVTTLGADMATATHRVRILTHIDDAKRHADLAIVATDAAPRRRIFESVRSKVDVEAWVFEKVLFQTRRDLDEVEWILAREGRPAWVNCGRRGFPGYRDLKLSLDQRKIEAMAVEGSHIGLACNAIHFTDLFEFMTDQPLSTINASALTPGYVESKRPGYVEVYGTLSGGGQGGARFTIESLDRTNVPLVVTFIGPQFEARIDEARRTLTMCHNGECSTRLFETRYVSQMPYLLTDILDEGRSDLPDYTTSAAQHRLLLDALREHLCIDIEQDAPCPIS